MPCLDAGTVGAGLRDRPPSGSRAPRSRSPPDDHGRRFPATVGRARGRADPADPLRVAGNLPYNVASPMLVKLVDLYLTGAAPGRCHRHGAARSRRTRGRRAGRTRVRRAGVLGRHTRARVGLLCCCRPAPSGRRRKCSRRLVRLVFRPPDTRRPRPRGLSAPGAGCLQPPPEDARQRPAGLRPATDRTGAVLGRVLARGRRRPAHAASWQTGRALAASSLSRPAELCYSFDARMARLCFSQTVSRSSRPVYLRRAQQPD